MTSPASERYVDDFLFQWRQLPYVDEPRIIFNGGHLMSKSFAPHVQVPRLLVLLLLTAVGSAVALMPYPHRNAAKGGATGQEAWRTARQLS